MNTFEGICRVIGSKIDHGLGGVSVVMAMQYSESQRSLIITLEYSFSLYSIGTSERGGHCKVRLLVCPGTQISHETGSFRASCSALCSDDVFRAFSCQPQAFSTCSMQVYLSILASV